MVIGLASTDQIAHSTSSAYVFRGSITVFTLVGAIGMKAYKRERQEHCLVHFYALHTLFRCHL